MNQATPDEVARRAYSLWETQGRPHGLDREHWEQAERELAGSAEEVRPDDPPALAAESTDTPAPARKVTRRATAKAKVDAAPAEAAKPKRAPRKVAAKLDA